ncbi:response regulator transcription factor [Synechococcus sp. RSCCF101]|uniref:response regulator transcription factor n=1 Tax=Synechococcus sp. RSCCF101 TaxID=2511069 RepID=UPI001245D1B1|nr:response regulator transcription factor [Synechococcus sp. RSCCF101]QEY31952.1 response regulator transcription factor [Synechococcus sp. RSCCF101]
MTSEPQVLLIGESAAALAERIRASGYGVLDWSSGAATGLAATGPHPAVALLASTEAGLIPVLRQRFGGMPLLLDIEEDTLENRAGCLSAGADDFWLSGHPPSELLQRLRCHLQSQARLQRCAPLLWVGDLSLDPGSRDARRGTRLLELTAREHDLLELLMLRQGQVLSRELILSHVWDDPDAASNVVEVYIRYLRQKLEQQGEPRLIHTVRGQGYCLSESPPDLRNERAAGRAGDGA